MSREYHPITLPRAQQVNNLCCHLPAEPAVPPASPVRTLRKRTASWSHCCDNHLPPAHTAAARPQTKGRRESSPSPHSVTAPLLPRPSTAPAVPEPQRREGTNPFCPEITFKGKSSNSHLQVGSTDSGATFPSSPLPNSNTRGSTLWSLDTKAGSSFGIQQGFLGCPHPTYLQAWPYLGRSPGTQK